MRPGEFSLPEFVRISWTSRRAREVWAPRLQEIGAVWRELEWRSVASGVRAVNLHRFAPADLDSLAPALRASGLVHLTLRAEGATPQGYATRVRPPVPGETPLLAVAVGRPPDLADFQAAWDDQDDDAMGALLGYPECCRRFFTETWVGRGAVDTTWWMASTGPWYSLSLDEIEVDGDPMANLLWRWVGVRPVPHLPCGFSCAPTADLGNRLWSLAEELGYSEPASWLRAVLAWPVDWSALHGIAEVHTPILRISARTDYTPGKQSVRFRGTSWPEEAAVSPRFPYAPPRKKPRSELVAIRVGLETARAAHQGDAQPSQASWYHRDNEFRSAPDMERLHRPIVDLAHRALDGSGGRILDLGCGNGALLEKICRDRPDLVPCGIEARAESLAHAPELLGERARECVVGNLHAPEAWPDGPFRLGILMIGRLTEVDSNIARRTVDALREQCDEVLAYAYTDWETSFESALAQAGARVLAREGDTAALVRFDLERV